MASRLPTNVAKSQATEETPMYTIRGGNDREGGFELTFDRGNRLLRMRLWGLWSSTIAVEFEQGVIKLGRALQGARRAPWSILADSRQFKAQSQEVTDRRKKAMAQAAALGCSQIASIVGNAVHTMQFRRIASEAHMPCASFEDESTAMQWLFEQEPPSR